MGIYYFPSNFVFWKKLPNHENIKRRILDFINTNPEILEPHRLIHNGKSSYSNIQLLEFVTSNHDICNSIIWEPLHEVIRELNSKELREKVNISSAHINDLWCSKYDANSRVSFHNHDHKRDVSYIDGIIYKPAFVFLYIVNDTNVSSGLEFIQPSSCGVSVYTSTETKLYTSKIKDIGEGTVMVFPANLYHQVEQIVESGRVIMSANIHCKFE